METFTKLFEHFLVFVYHCFDRIVIQGYLPLLTRPEHIVHFFRDVHGQYPITGQVLAKRTLEYRGWVAAYAHNHKIPMLKAEQDSEQGGLRPSSSTTNGAAQTTRCLLHLHQHGNGQHVQFKESPVPHRRSELPHHPAWPLPFPALLLLHPRSGDRPAGHVHRHLPSLSNHVLPERASLHGD